MSEREAINRLRGKYRNVDMTIDDESDRLADAALSRSRAGRTTEPIPDMVLLPAALVAEAVEWIEATIFNEEADGSRTIKDRDRKLAASLRQYLTTEKP